jgi:hypothetical protein
MYVIEYTTNSGEHIRSPRMSWANATAVSANMIERGLAIDLCVVELYPTHWNIRVA